ncbi:MAG: sodium-translocating pyrophosphatase [Thermoplasmata archaeon]|jgi:K(+)-stimulated pyrophosphate-energized sodium pump|nr:sodium-translocating pyrophosphatase [Thermoplasmata archaeon]
MIDVFSTDNLLFMIPVAAVVAVIFAAYFFKSVWKVDKGTPEMQKISNAIETGAMAYLKRQYKTIGIVIVVLAVVIALAGLNEDFEDYLNWKVSIAFVIGAAFSILSGYIGMKVSVNSNIRTASAARTSLNDAFKTSFRGGALSGIAVSALSLIGLFLVIFVYEMAWGVEDDESLKTTLRLVVGYAFGASFAALFAQLGGGIYTKAADVGADLVGKVEAGIPEDDPRNPAVIADLVGDNVGDCAGRGADIFESTAAEIIGSMVIGSAVVGMGLNFSANWVFLPLVLMAFGLIASLVGILVVRLKDDNADVCSSLNIGYYVTIALNLVFLGLTTYMLLKDEIDSWYYFFIAGVVGIALGLAIVYITQYYTGDHKPVKGIAAASETGAATNVIEGIAMGLESTVLPVVCIVIAIISTYTLGYFAAPDFADKMIFGFYGTAVGTIAMLASSAFILAEDTFGPITDNGGGIAEMSNQPEEVRNRTDKLDSAGNTTKALTKGYAMASAALAAFLLFASIAEVVADVKTSKGTPTTLSAVFNINIGEPLIFVGALVGAVLVFYFASLAIRAVSKAAGEMIEEVRRQFRENKGIMEGTQEPDYASCVDIATRGALRAMVLPALLPILVPLIFGLIYKYVLVDIYDMDYLAYTGVLALVIGGTIVGILMANFLNNGGGAWDNAKKYIEEGNHGGKKSPAHAAAVVGDTIGDPFKDTAGPSIHVLVKLLSTICLVTAVLFV